MSNKLQKLIYFLSATAPILIVFAIVWIIQKSHWEKPILIEWKGPVMLLIIAIGLIVAFSVSFRYGKRNLQKMRVTASEISSDDGWIVAYVVSYLIPLASFQIGDVIRPVMAIVLFILIVTITITDYITPHPLLYFRGYHFYLLDVEGAQSGYHLISKKKLRRAEDVKVVSQVFEFLLLRKG